MPGRFPQAVLAAVALLGATSVNAAAPPTEPAAADGALERPALTREQGLVMLDYEVIPVPGLPSIDLMGFHVFNRFGNGLYVGVGGFAPLIKGEYGGFMAFDVSAHLQRPIYGRWFGTAGVSLGGGGGGKSAQQSKVLSGSGGYAKGYAGLGYAFDDFSVGLNIARFRFNGSAIGHTQPNVFLQVPFGYTAGAYTDAGLRMGTADSAPDERAESSIRLGLDNYRQLDPTGANKGTINLVNMQYSRYFAGETYGFADISLGYHGLPLYNQVVAGIGRRLPISPRVSLYGQLGIGSGGYAPDTIDTGPGLLLYPMIAGEFKLTPDLGFELTAGYLAAPRGTSRNVSIGAALNYRISPGTRGGDAANPSGGESVLRGYRFHVLQQTEFNVSRTTSTIRMLTMQIDMLLSERVYIPLQGSVAGNAYVGYPGYGEALAGLGLSSQAAADERVQFFGQLLAGPNVHGLVVKPQLGISIALGDRLALHAQGGRTIGIGSYGTATNRQKFRADDLALGLSWRFALPGQ